MQAVQAFMESVCGVKNIKQYRPDTFSFCLFLASYGTNKATNLFSYSSLHFSFLRLRFGQNRDPSPPPVRPRKRNNFNLCSRSWKQEEGKSSFFFLSFWFFSKLPAKVQSCIRTEPSLHLIYLPAPRCKLLRL